MKTLTLTLAMLVAAPLAFGDGLPLKNGRYPGSVFIFTLTETQKRVIEQYRTCHLEKSMTMNMYTPYIFELTTTQAAAVAKKVGFVPSRFAVYETVRGFNDAGPHWNLALRYSENNIEIPQDLLRPDIAADAAQKEQGWKRENPCFPAPLNLLGQRRLFFA